MADSAAAKQAPSGIFKRMDEDPDSTKKEASNIHQALVWVHKAKAGSVQWVDKCTEEQYNYYLMSKKMKWLSRAAKYGLLLCCVMDTPYWCRGTPEACANYVKQLYSPAFPIMTPTVGVGVSLILWAILGFRMYIRKLGLGDSHSFHQWHLFTASVIMIGFMSAFLSLFLPPFYQLSVLCRPFAFMGCTKSLREGFHHIIVSIPGFLDVLVSLAICVFVCVWSGMVMFCRIPEGYADFFAWRQGFAQMWILFTTNNTPNVVMPAINQNRAYFWFFLTYLLITVFLLGNVLLARVYDTYKEVLSEHFRQFNENQKVGVARAWSYLSKDNVIKPETWRNFFVAYCDPELGSIQASDPDDVDYNMERANKILKASDVNMDNTREGMNQEQFKKVMNVVFDKGIYIPKQKPPERDYEGTIMKPLQDFMRNGYYTSDTADAMKITWDGTMDCIITIGTILVFYESWMWAHTYNTKQTFLNLRERPIYYILMSFSVIYAMALTMKISTLGWERFWYRNTFQHRFDFCNVYGLFICEMIFLFVFPSIAMARTVILLQMARGVRLFYYVGPLKEFFRLMTRLVPVYYQMGMILFVIFWIFTDIGMLWFGGLIYTSNPNLVGTDFAGPGFEFFELNFNCWLDGMITLFTLMCMNNWSDTSDGYMQASQQYMSQAFFVGFTIVCNLIVLNILIALILDCTGVLKEELEKEQEAEDEQGGGGVSHDFLRKVVCDDDDGSDDDDDDESSSEGSDGQDLGMAAESSTTMRRSRKSGRATVSGGKRGSSNKDETAEDQKRLSRLTGKEFDKSSTSKRKSVA